MDNVHSILELLDLTLPEFRRFVLLKPEANTAALNRAYLDDIALLQDHRFERFEESPIEDRAIQTIFIA